MMNIEVRRYMKRKLLPKMGRLQLHAYVWTAMAEATPGHTLLIQANYHDTVTL